ncbi:Dynein beta chain ciliary [Fasciola gigantica]|uniref:Dynein beta chain ciliary n=1 Tax=Fasciola gigantica TaxID=46835 RepID=A0A504YNP5_FASGI|nr:Dynein beta chain ciliary [Fasciola gigantica]
MASNLDLDDKRVEFVADYVLKSNKIKGDKWMKLWNNDDSKKMILGFFDKPEILQLFISMNSAGFLQAQTECPSGIKAKACFFMKKEKCIIKKDSSVNRLLVYGDLSQNPLDHFSAFVDEVQTFFLVFSHSIGSSSFGFKQKELRIVARCCLRRRGEARSWIEETN